MASYKVPQDVEADDKLIGPFSFRQFIYLLIVGASIAVAWVLGNLLLPLAILPLPIILFFGALALPLKKDQPMETYLAAIISFYLKPHTRKWDPDGRDHLIEIIAPKVVEVHRSKDLSGSEAENRLSYLAQLVDSHGWSVRGVDGMQQVDEPDMLDDTSGVGQSLHSRLDLSNARRHEQMVASMHQPQMPQLQSQQTPRSAPAQTQPQPVAQPQADPHLSYNPYPSMRQSVVDPSGNRSQQQSASQQPAQNQPQTPSENHLSADIMNLANNSDLSVETIAREANRIHQKEQLPKDEVVISLR